MKGGVGTGRVTVQKEKMKRQTFFLFVIKIAPSRFSYLLKIFT